MSEEQLNKLFIEIVAVLAHEIGHWKLGQIWKRLLRAELLAFFGAWLGYELLARGGLPSLLGLPADLSLSGQLVVLGFVASLATFPLGPLSAWRSDRSTAASWT